MLTPAQRRIIAAAITDAMREQYKEQGETGDFADGFRYLATDASDAELHDEHNKWCKNNPASHLNGAIINT